MLEAMGCDQAISKDFAKLQLHDDDDDSSSSDEDSDDFPDIQSETQGREYPHMSEEFEDDQGQTAALRSSSTSSSTPSKHADSAFKQKVERDMKKTKKMMKREKKMKKMMKREKKKKNKFELQKKKMDAKARTAIRNSIDAKAFERSTFDCKTAYELWTTLKPTEAYTEEEIHRALSRVRIETCSNDMELVERMYDVVNKAQYAMPDKRKQYETQAVQAALLNLK